jgi:glycerol-3-phosphate acyltransferase PlsY
VPALRLPPSLPRRHRVGEGQPVIAAFLVGLLIGSIPSADLLARRRGLDLRRTGSGNPGAANALGVGGRSLAITVLAFDLIKGASAALLGWWWGGEGGAAAASVAAIAGQVRNPWFRGRGGKGLGVTGGTILTIWPTGALAVVPVIGIGSRLWGSAPGTLLGLGALLGGAMAWALQNWPMAWGISPDDVLVWYALGVVAVVAPKFVAGLRRS